VSSGADDCSVSSFRNVYNFMPLQLASIPREGEAPGFSVSTVASIAPECLLLGIRRMLTVNGSLKHWIVVAFVSSVHV
jgi:hypothetical protein